MSKESSDTPVYKKWWFWVIIVLVGLPLAFYLITAIFLGSVAKSTLDAASSIVEDVNNDTKNSGDSTDNSSNVYKVGETVKFDNQDITITSVNRNYTTNNSYTKAGDGKEYVKVNLQIKNTSDGQIDYNAFYWSIEDSSGDITNYTSAAMAQADDTLSSGQLAAGGTKTASIVFEVPKDDTKLKVHINPGLISAHEAIVEL